MTNFQDKANFIWQVADDILFGAFMHNEFRDVVLPFLVLRRLDCIFENAKPNVLKMHEEFKDKLPELEPVLLKASGGLNFFNVSPYDLKKLSQDAKNIELNFNNYLNGYSSNVREILENFQLDKVVAKLVKNDLLFQLVDKFTEIDLHIDKVSNLEMGYIYEELLRRFNEFIGETAGHHFTPREIIRLMCNLLFAEHADDLQGEGVIRTIYDPACGTGGMLTVAKEHIHQHINPSVELRMYGQELNEQTYAVAKSDFLVSGENPENIRPESSFSKDKFRTHRFKYMLSNPPFGVSWKKEQAFIEKEANDPHGRFYAGLPRSSDGALLFLQHMISKMEASGSRIAIIFNGSPLFTGDAGGGESNIRKWIIENDMLEAIVALPKDMFYNTGIATYIWLVTNRKTERRKGKVQLINAVDFSTPGASATTRKSLGSKRNYISDAQIAKITAIYTGFAEGEYCKIFDNTDFGYTKVTVERPLLVKEKVRQDRQGNPKPDGQLRDTEKIPLKDDIDAYFKREVLPHVSDAWMEREKDKIGYEINFTKYFYKFTPLRSLAEIKADILALEEQTEGLLKEILD